MAVQPRARVRRAVNLETPEGPIVPPSETKAREAYRANKQKNHFASIEKEAFKEAHKLFVAENRSTFELVEGNKTIVVEIAAQKDKDEVDMDKFYALVQSGEITLPQFISACKATQGDVKSKLGSNVLAKVLVGKPQEPKFQITEKKEG